MTTACCGIYCDDDACEDDAPPAWPPLPFHLQPQDTSLPGWNALLQLVEDAIADKREVFAPKVALGSELWSQIVTLPASIAGLKHVRKLHLYRSHLLRIPPEIGAMESLEEFVPYTSYGLHWFPFEITRCARLKSSTVSTRALYGNHKYRPPFPSLESRVDALVPTHCSVCAATMRKEQVEQVWLSRCVATDVLPLLVNACSAACIADLPAAAEGYIQGAHKGGNTLRQP